MNLSVVFTPEAEEQLVELYHYVAAVAGQAVLDDGLVIGGVRHQFRDVDGAMEAVLTVEFPRVFPSRMVAEHRWHLATEFGNWITAFSNGANPPKGSGG